MTIAVSSSLVILLLDSAGDVSNSMDKRDHTVAFHLAKRWLAM